MCANKIEYATITTLMYPRCKCALVWLQHGKNWPKQVTPPTTPSKKLKVSKGRPSTAKHILFKHDSKDILQKKKRHKTHRGRQVMSRVKKIAP